MTNNNLITALVYASATVIAAAISNSSNTTRHMSSLEAELHDEAQRHESEARHLRKLERIEREHKWEIDELHQLRTAREEQERLRKQQEAEEAARLEREHEELLMLRKEVNELRRKEVVAEIPTIPNRKNRHSSRPVPPTPTPYATTKETDE